MARQNGSTGTPAEIRRFLMWFAPLAVVLIAAVWLLAVPQLVATIQGLHTGASIVRIGAADPVAVMLLPLSVLLLAALSLKAVPVHQRWIARVMWWFHLTLWAALGLAVIGIPVNVVLQHRLMPERGYTVCDHSPAQRSVWFNDWAKDPMLCANHNASATR